jgi:hypothetical protein
MSEHSAVTGKTPMAGAQKTIAMFGGAAALKSAATMPIAKSSAPLRVSTPPKRPLRWWRRWPSGKSKAVNGASTPRSPALPRSAKPSSSRSMTSPMRGSPSRTLSTTAWTRSARGTPLRSSLHQSRSSDTVVCQWSQCQWGWAVSSFFTCSQVVSGLRPFADRAVERESSPNDNHGERLRFVSTMDLPELGLNFPAMQCDEVQTWIPREWADA